MDHPKLTIKPEGIIHYELISLINNGVSTEMSIKTNLNSSQRKERTKSCFKIEISFRFSVETWLQF